LPDAGERHLPLFGPAADNGAHAMRLKINMESDTLYLRLDEAAIIESEEVQPSVILDYDSNGRVIGIELLSLSLRTTPEKLRMLQFETVG
jgi:uncharacterized protein YuzE